MQPNDQSQQFGPPPTTPQEESETPTATVASVLPPSQAINEAASESSAVVTQPTEPIAPAPMNEEAPAQVVINEPGTDDASEEPVASTSTDPSATLQESAVAMPGSQPEPPAPLPTPSVAPSAEANTMSSSDATSVYEEICNQIIREQQEIIGSLAIDQAQLVPGLIVDRSQGEIRCRIQGDHVAVIDGLIAQYQDFFGHAAVEVCREAASQLLTRLEHTEIPASLR